MKNTCTFALAIPLLGSALYKPPEYSAVYIRLCKSTVCRVLENENAPCIVQPLKIMN